MTAPPRTRPTPVPAPHTAAPAPRPGPAPTPPSAAPAPRPGPAPTPPSAAPAPRPGPAPTPPTAATTPAIAPAAALPVQRRPPFLRRLVEVLPPPVVGAPAPRPPRPHTGDPEAARAADRVLRVAVEVVAGRRPVGQLEAVLAPSVRSRLRWLHRSAGHLRVRVLTVRCQQSTPGVLEAVAVVGTCNGARALAARFEQVVDRTGDRWACTALDLKLTAGDQVVHRRVRPAHRGAR